MAKSKTAARRAESNPVLSWRRDGLHIAVVTVVVGMYGILSTSQLATERQAEVLSLADLQKLDEYRVAADGLWPAVPEQVPAMDTWLSSAAGLEQRGAGPGTHVGLLAPNWPEWLVIAWAVWRTGAVLVPGFRAKLDKCRQQLQTMHQQLAGAKKQPDEPGEVERLEAQIAAIHAEIAKLKQNA